MGSRFVCYVSPQTNAYAQVAPIEQRLSGGENEAAAAEALIRHRVEDWANSIHAIGDTPMVGDLAVLDTHNVDRLEMNLAISWSDCKKWPLA
jgi:hypothetical protein